MQSGHGCNLIRVPILFNRLQSTSRAPSCLRYQRGCCTGGNGRQLQWILKPIALLVADPMRVGQGTRLSPMLGKISLSGERACFDHSQQTPINYKFLWIVCRHYAQLSRALTTTRPFCSQRLSSVSTYVNIKCRISCTAGSELLTVASIASLGCALPLCAASAFPHAGISV